MSAVKENKMPLEDVMAAMDVVDTLRHQQDLVERELDGKARRERLLVKLRELYQAQGIEVPDHVLYEGIDALEQERFQYKPVAPSWKTRLAHIWVSRKKWSKPLSFLTLLGGLFTGVYVVNDVLPERTARQQLPGQLQSSLSQIQNTAKSPAVIEQALQRYAAAQQALAKDDLQQAQQVYSEMESVSALLNKSYTIRIASRPNELSGIWRVPDVNKKKRNYYLIVEAVDSNNNVVELPVLNEESNKRIKKKKWGLRVDEDTFYKVARDKKDDGIIQANVVGKKSIGFLQPQFSIPTSGATITDW